MCVCAVACARGAARVWRQGCGDTPSAPLSPRHPHPPLQTISPLRGFSSAKFLPGSRDTVLIALKSEENSELDRQTSYFTIFGEGPGGTWRVLMEEVELPGEVKFEGLEVLSWT